jgi:hypothetical protein
MIRTKEKMTIKRLLELNSNYIRNLRKEEKSNAARLVIEDVLKWATYTNYEAVGVLDCVKQHFIVNAEEVREVEPYQLRTAHRYT